MSPSYQAVQSSHALTDLIFKYPKDSLDWHRTSNTIVLLAVENERVLLDIQDQLTDSGMKFASFLEPDIQNELTAIAILPSEEAKQFCSNLKLAKLCLCSSIVERSTLNREVPGASPGRGAMGMQTNGSCDLGLHQGASEPPSPPYSRVA